MDLENGTNPRRTWTEHQAARSVIAAVALCACWGASGCAAVGKTVGTGLMVTGGAATVVTGFLGAGCTETNPETNQVRNNQPCMPAQTYDEYAPVIWGTFVTGIIMFAAGVAAYVTATEPPKKDPAIQSRPPKDPLEEERCSDPKYCY